MAPSFHDQSAINPTIEFLIFLEFGSHCSKHFDGSFCSNHPFKHLGSHPTLYIHKYLLFVSSIVPEIQVQSKIPLF